MARSLPDKPSIEHLKNEAKSLQKAHSRREKCLCSKLKCLKKFKDVATEDILSVRLSLSDAQHAIAIDYGFKNWSDLRAHVASVRCKPLAGKLRSDGESKWIEGIEKSHWGGGSEKQNTVMGAIEAAMSLLGKDVSFTFLMGVSGAAFRLQMAFPTWCPSAPHGTCGFDCSEPALVAMGLGLSWIEGKDGDISAFEKRRGELVASIDSGRPAIFNGVSCEVIVGYKNRGETMLLRRGGSSEAGYSPFKNWTWQTAGIIDERSEPVPRKLSLIQSLRRAVKLSGDEQFGKYSSGFQVYDKWIAGLLDEDSFRKLSKADSIAGMCQANAWHYLSLADDRREAGRYLRSVAKEFPAAIGSCLRSAGEIYGRIEKCFFSERDELPMPYMLFPWDLDGGKGWSQQMREAQASILREVLVLERQAIAQIEAALLIIESISNTKENE